MPNIDVNNSQTGVYNLTYRDILERSSNATYVSSRDQLIVKRNSVGSPNFTPRRIALRNLPMNPFSFYRVFRKFPVGSYVVTNKSWPFDVITRSGCLDGVMVQDSQTDRTLSLDEQYSADAVCRNKVLLKVKDMKINLGQVGAERKMSSDTVVKMATRVVDAITDLKRGNLALAASHLGIKVSKRANARNRANFRKSQPKAIANGWLELQYGWKPLMQDMYGACELLANEHAGIVKGRVVANHTVRVSTTESVKEDFNTKTLAYETEYTVKYVLYYSEGNPVLHDLTAMGITNPALIAWELVPFSFVVDWFLPIGNFLSTLDASFGLNFEKGSVTTFRRTTCRQTWRANLVERNYDTVNGSAEATCNYVEVKRGRLFDFPNSALPQFKDPLSLLHAANAVALVIQLFKK